MPFLVIIVVLAALQQALGLAEEPLPIPVQETGERGGVSFLVIGPTIAIKLSKEINTC